MTLLQSWKLIDIDNIEENTGSIHIAEFGKHFSFKVERIFYLSNIVRGEIRGEHAHLTLNQFIKCVAGSFDIELDNGCQVEKIHMTVRSPGLFVDGLVWRTMSNFSKDAVMLVLCDKVYEQDTVIRDYDAFLMEANKNNE